MKMPWGQLKNMNINCCVCCFFCSCFNMINKKTKEIFFPLVIYKLKLIWSDSFFYSEAISRFMWGFIHGIWIGYAGEKFKFLETWMGSWMKNLETIRKDLGGCRNCAAQAF